MKRIRVVIADDQALVRTGFRLVLETHGDAVVTGEASTGRAAVAVARSTSPDVVLMDVQMPDMDGITATRLITNETNAKVIVLTTFARESYSTQALAAGASAFLLKDVRPATLLTTLQRVHEDDAVIPPSLHRAIHDASGPRAGASDLAHRYALLSARERDVLLAIAQGLDNASIGERLFISESTVKKHVGRVIAKLAVRDRVGAVIAAYDLGIAGG